MASPTATRLTFAIRMIGVIVAFSLLCVSGVLFRKAFILADQEWFGLWFTGRRITFGDDDSGVLATVGRTLIYAVIPAIASIAILTSLRKTSNPAVTTTTNKQQ